MSAYLGSVVNGDGTLLADKKRFGTGPVGDDSVDVLTAGGLDIPMKAAKAMGYINDAESAQYVIPGNTLALPVVYSRVDGLEVLWDASTTLCVWDASTVDAYSGPTLWSA